MKLGNYLVRWNYIPVAYPQTNTESTKTRCQVLNPETHKIVCEGEVTKFHKDVFCKDTARKRSLSQALRNSRIPKDERYMVWEDYRTKGKNPLWGDTQQEAVLERAEEAA